MVAHPQGCPWKRAEERGPGDGEGWCGEREREKERERGGGEREGERERGRERERKREICSNIRLTNVVNTEWNPSARIPLK